MAIEQNTIRVWDPFVRAFHWSLVLAYAIAWASAENWDWLHEQSGYFVMTLVVLRLIWGVIGSRHARFTDFIRSPGETLAYLRSLRAGRPRHYLGHNPAGGWMIVALILALLATGATGILMDGGASELWEELHEAAANLSILLVVVHVAGVLIASLMHEENLVRAMLTGNKKREHSDV